MARRPRGRPGRFAPYDELEACLPENMTKRARYVNGIGLFRGRRGTTIWLKLTLPKGGSFKGRTYAPGEAVEVKLGNRDAWTWEEAEAALSDLQRRAQHGQPLEDVPEQTFSSYAAQWLRLKRSTMKGWDIPAGHVRNHLAPTFGAKLLSKITAADVNSWVADQLEGNAPATVQRQLNTLKAILNHAMRTEALERSPLRGVEPVRGVEARQRWLSDDELRVVLAAAERIEAENDGQDGRCCPGWLRSFVLWALHSGMRRGEIVATRFRLLRSDGKGTTYVVIEETKSGKPRVITCTDQMLAIIEPHASGEAGSRR